MTERKLQKGDWIVFLVIIIAVSAAFASYWYFFLRVEGAGPRTVKTGDRINVDYVGWLESGEVFDTSQWDVASDNFSYPKTVSFGLRPKEQYKPFELTVGQGVITGWSEGVVGMSLGEVRRLVIPPDKAYGFPDKSKIEVRQLVESRPLTIELNDTEFEKNYSTKPAVGAVANDKVYGWPVRVLSVDGGIVTAVVVAEKDDVFQTQWPWKIRVLNVDSSANGGRGEVRIQHALSEKDENHVTGTENGAKFFITSVDETAGTFEFNKNDFLAGKTLIFRIKMLKFT
jgi:FKBP-type peptidyl-prolyl cis-trans isomerase 2